jgi:hypothetical protein
VAELAVRLGFDASLVDIWFLTFRDLVIVFVGVLTVEGEATTPSRNVGNQVPSGAASYPEERDLFTVSSDSRSSIVIMYRNKLAVHPLIPVNNF